MITGAQLSAIAPHCKSPDDWADALNAAMTQFNIAQDAQDLPDFLAQIAFESQQFNVLAENLNYSAPRLMAVWPDKFPTLDVAVKYAANPHGLADYVYANQYGNGDESSGDGWTYRGRGLIMLTFKANYQSFATAVGLPAVIYCPDMLLTKPTAALAAAWFWSSHGLDALAEAGQFQTITRRINGGNTGEARREQYLAAAQAALA
jgi:putative chitinase